MEGVVLLLHNVRLVIVLIVFVAIMLVLAAPARGVIVIPTLAPGLVAMLVQVPKTQMVNALKVQRHRTAVDQIIALVRVMLAGYRRQVMAVARLAINVQIATLNVNYIVCARQII